MSDRGDTYLWAARVNLARAERGEAEAAALRETLTQIAQLSSTQYHPAPPEDRLHMIYELAIAAEKPHTHE
jgi:hypothetical protein